MTIKVSRIRSPGRTIVWILSLLPALLWPASGWAASVTTNEADMDIIFMQTSIGATIDIRFNPTVTIANSSLLNIDSIAKLNLLFSLSPVVTPGVNMFFVDTVSACGVTNWNPGIDGCADIGGNDIVVESVAAADTTSIATLGTNVTAGALLNAHELGHNLGLPHTAECASLSPANLMECTLLGAELTPAQATTILASGLVQMGGGIPPPLFVDITPVLIIASVPVPPAVWLFGSALAILGFVRRTASR